MTDVFSFFRGDTPLLISVPHDGRHVPPDVRARMTAAGAALPDTDWHVAELYAFARELGASMLIANYSRYVVDLNRSAGDDVLYPGQVATGLCPVQTFSGDDIYASSPPANAEMRARVRTCWQPYHDKLESVLAELLAKHGQALLWDAHSIASVVPRLFEGELPELNIGTNGGASCSPALEHAVAEAAATGPYSSVSNGRFRGGYITRHYGRPGGHVHAVQLEIAQRVYMDELTTRFDVRKAARLRDTLRRMLTTFIKNAEGN